MRDCVKNSFSKETSDILSSQKPYYKITSILSTSPFYNLFRRVYNFSEALLRTPASVRLVCYIDMTGSIDPLLSYIYNQKSAQFILEDNPFLPQMGVLVPMCICILCERTHSL